MEGEGAVDVFVQIRSLVSDRLQVISYKWLSRNFSVSSNNAKRLLNEFVEKHGNDLEVLYSISGWLKNSPKSYSVKLASKPKLEEAREEFEEISSVQVYSIQASIPNDTTVIWNSEFVQAEELFKQSNSQENCLWDNRFCGVSNSFVKRTVDQKNAISLPPKPKAEAFRNDIQSLKPPLKEEQVSNSESKIETKSEKVSKPCIVKEEKVKGQMDKSSLANMWGRASNKPKPVKEPSDHSPIVAGTADAQICAKEDEKRNSNCEDEEEDEEIGFKKSNNGSGNKKRRVIFYFSDDENEPEPELEPEPEQEENVISLASPEPPKIPEISKKPETLTVIKEEKNLEEKKEEAVKSNSSGDKGKEEGSVKRRKVLKKRIDDRGREVSEFVWEGEESPSDKLDQNNNTSKDTNNRDKIPAINTDGEKDKKANNKAPSNSSGTVNKSGVNKKPTKAGTKDGKQGNIMSFFKKI